MFQIVGIAITGIVLFLVHSIGLVIYRLYFSPVSHIPGPFLAKTTFWYEFYYDAVLKGQYTFKIKKLHEKYGPIIRINPEEVHIADADFYDAIYTGPSHKRDKWSWFCDQFGIPDSVFSAVKHDQHRIRRAALNPFFSKGKVRSLQPLIEEVVRKLLARFEEFHQLGEPLPISFGFAALTNDIAEQYAFGRNDSRVLARDFDPSFHNASVAGGTTGLVTKQFPIIRSLMQSLPDEIVVFMNSDMASYFKLQKDIKTQVASIYRDRDGATYKAAAHHTIFHEILNSDLPDSEKSFPRLWQDGQVTVVAGTLTTASALSCTLYFLLSQPDLLLRLRDELQAAIPDPNHVPPLVTLENLPFLTACINEGLRLSNGVSSRLQRIDPDKSIVFTDKMKNNGKDYILPPGTPLSMTGMLIHLDPKIFSQPLAFNPDRWLQEPGLHRYLVPFGRGTRQCIGINLAYAEIYITLSMIFRSYGSADVKMDGDRGYLELFDTQWERDVKIVGDAFVPLNRKDSKGIRIQVRQ